MGPDHERRLEEMDAEKDRSRNAEYERLIFESLTRRLRNALRVATLITGRSQAVHDLLAEADLALTDSTATPEPTAEPNGA